MAGATGVALLHCAHEEDGATYEVAQVDAGATGAAELQLAQLLAAGAEAGATGVGAAGADDQSAHVLEAGAGAGGAGADQDPQVETGAGAGLVEVVHACHSVVETLTGVGVVARNHVRANI